jgi:hypothetical protein
MATLGEKLLLPLDELIELLSDLSVDTEPLGCIKLALLGVAPRLSEACEFLNIMLCILINY